MKVQFKNIRGTKRTGPFCEASIDNKVIAEIFNSGNAGHIALRGKWVVDSKDPSIKNFCAPTKSTAKKWIEMQANRQNVIVNLSFGRSLNIVF